MTLFRLVTGLYFFAVLLVAFCTASRVVNISDAWLLSDSESPVFYRHFRDRVTWSEAEAICQFHHSVLATVRNTGEFDRTRALLQELAWTTPVWVGLRRVLGQPMFKWSTPPGATLLPADGYWHETPGPMGGTRALCVTVDPAADFRWRAVDCASSAELFSFLCQIPVPSWARSEHGGCLSPHWPSDEVTVQYLPQTRALEMTADCGLAGTKRLACKQHSTVDVKHMELKLQCPNGATAAETSIATPPRPPTRHRRDTKASTAATPHVATTDVTAEKISTEVLEKESIVTEKTVLENTDSVLVTEKTGVSEKTDVSEKKDIPEETVVSEKTGVPEKTDITKKTVVSEKTVTELPEKTNPDIISTSRSPEFNTPARTTSDVRSSTTPSIVVISTSPPAIVTGTPRAITPETTTIVDTTTKPAVTTSPSTRLTTLAITAGIPPVHMHSVHHQVSPGTPRNVAALTHIANHPPMVIAVSAAGLPRNVASVPREHAPLPPPLLHPVIAEGTPRIANNAEIHRSAEEFVTSWRRQFLPSPLRGISTPHTHPHSTTPEDVEDEEEEETTAAAATAEPMNSQTEEELLEAARRRQHSRRTSRPQQSSHPGRNLYPYLINRMLG